MNPSKSNIRDLIEYCSAKGITVHPLIQPRQVPGCGFGVYAVASIKSDQQLIHVPTDQIFTTSNIPETFLSKVERENVAVHAQLAAFFAFGNSEDLEPYRPWTDTWPIFEDFYETMPLFWGEALRIGLEDGHKVSDAAHHPEKKSPVSKKRKVEDGSKYSAHSPPATVKITDGIASVRSLNTVRDQTAQMIEKLVSHIVSVRRALPYLDLDRDHEKMVRFLHAWCLVNTRCFYYVPTTTKQDKTKKSRPQAPADPNEAMGLFPFMDLFNHMASSTDTTSRAMNGGITIQTPCKVRSGVIGFTATTTSGLEADQEILFCYGPHTNDTLWSEYGFILPTSCNTSDSVPLDDAVLDSLAGEERSTLENHGYLGTYTLFNDGSVCYRTEMTAWIVVIGTHKWKAAVEEGLDPADLVQLDTLTTHGDSARLVKGLEHRNGTTIQQEHCKVIKAWLLTVRDRARKDARKLRSMRESEICIVYGTLSIVANVHRQLEGSRLSVAKRRHKMCVDRCEQIEAMASRGVDAAVADLMNGT